MKHKFYSQCGLLILNDGYGERLFKVGQHKGKRKAVPVDFIGGAQKFITVCQEHNLVITPTGLFTLKGETVEEGDFAAVKTVCYRNTLLLIFQNSSTDERVEKVWLWNKNRVVWRQNPEKLIYTDKYIAVFLKGFWKIYNTKGRPIGIERALSSPIQIKGDLLISDAVGCHDLYSLKTGVAVMCNQQLLNVSARRDFAIGVNLQRTATLWCDGISMTIDNVAFADIIDEAELFFIKYQNFTHYTVFRYAASLSALSENLEFTAVEFISYDEKGKQLVVATDKDILFFKTENENIGGNIRIKFVAQ